MLYLYIFYVSFYQVKMLLIYNAKTTNMIIVGDWYISLCNFHLVSDIKYNKHM